ncbi:MAG: sigma-70 family RNA polymerase sigma factor [Candidatus Rokubacteria bacterium]|nr:sigma-70 family RNA polymerase sigma factor [Candidatus Rokubacteria bacterium]
MLRWIRDGGQVSEFEGVALVHLDLLYRAALRLTHNRAEAEDLVQETWLRALRHFDQFDPGSNCRAWLLTILRNAFLNRVRREGREILESDMAATEAGAARLEEASVARSSPEEDFFQTVLHGDVDRALKTLSLPFRLVVTLADLEGLTYKEVAQVLDCPIGTVMSRLSRARQLLRKELVTLAHEHGYSKESR